MNYSLEMQCMLARARVAALIEDRVRDAKGEITLNFREARKRLLPDGETPSPTEQRQVREDSQGLGVPGRLSPSNGVRVGADSLAAALLKGYGGSTMTSGPAGAKLTIFYDNPDDGEPAHDALVRALDAARTNGVGEVPRG